MESPTPQQKFIERVRGRDTIADPKATRVPVLMSYAFLCDSPPAFVEWFMTDPRIERLIDSGAFTAMMTGKTIKLEEYCAFIRKWESQLFGYIALDVMGNPADTARNLQKFKPIPVFTLGDTQKRMEDLYALSEWVALGTLVKPKSSMRPPNYVALLMEWVAGRKTHWLGYTSHDMINAIRPFSCDCSSANSGARYGLSMMYLGQGDWQKCRFRENEKFSLDGRAWQILQDSGFTAEDWNCPVSWRMPGHRAEKRRRHCELVSEYITIDSFLRYSLELRQLVGTRLFLAFVPAMYKLFTQHLDRRFGEHPYPKRN